MLTPLGRIDTGDGWAQTTVTTVRRPGDDPSRAVSIVFKRHPTGNVDIDEVYRREKDALGAGFGGRFEREGESAVTFLGQPRPCLRYTVDIGGQRVTQALVAATCPYGVYTATASALATSFDGHWDELAEVVASFQPNNQGA